jgi:hypothetical protein
MEGWKRKPPLTVQRKANGVKPSVSTEDSFLLLTLKDLAFTVSYSLSILFSMKQNLLFSNHVLESCHSEQPWDWIGVP